MELVDQFRRHAAGLAGVHTVLGAFASVGTTPATAGVIRIPNANGLYGRNAANSANMPLIVLDSSNNVRLGDSTVAGVAIDKKLTVSFGGGGDFVFVLSNLSAATPYTLNIKEPAGPANGYPLITVNNNTGTIDYFRIDSGTGLPHFGAAGVAMGGGSAPTLGTIGGSGPATAGQNAWWKVMVGGVASYIPYWR